MRTRELIIPPSVYEQMLEILIKDKEMRDFDYAAKVLKEIKDKKIDISPNKQSQFHQMLAEEKAKYLEEKARMKANKTGGN